jgi:hypothetical protein
MARKKRATPPAGIVYMRKEAAALLGLTPQQLGTWAKELWFPEQGKTPDGWNVPVIREARDAYGKKGSEQSEEAKRIKLALQTEKLRQEKIKSERAEREERLAEGSLIPRDEYELAMIEQITMARDQILTLPKLLARIVPQRYHKKLLSEGDRKIRNVLEQLSKGFERIKTEGPD